jgi:hypothetical protein
MKASFKRLFTIINILRIISDQLSSDTRTEGNNAKVLANFWSIGTGYVRLGEFLFFGEKKKTWGILDKDQERKWKEKGDMTCIG